MLITDLIIYVFLSTLCSGQVNRAPYLGGARQRGAIHLTQTTARRNSEPVAIPRRHRNTLAVFPHNSGESRRNFPVSRNPRRQVSHVGGYRPSNGVVWGNDFIDNFGDRIDQISDRWDSVSDRLDNRWDRASDRISDRWDLMNDRFDRRDSFGDRPDNQWDRVNDRMKNRWEGAYDRPDNAWDR